MGKKFCNILQLSFGFLFIFAAFQSCSNIQEYVIQSIASQQNATSHIDSRAGFYSLAILYGVFTLFNFVAPFVVAKISSKWSMVIGALSYVLFLASFLHLWNVLFYACSALLGIGAALIWVGQGSFLIDNSNEETLNRNSGIFWAILQCSLPIGGLFIYTQVRNDRGNVNLSMDTVRYIYGGFTLLATFGSLILLLLRKSHPAESYQTNVTLDEQVTRRSTEDLVISADHESSQVDSVSRASPEPLKNVDFGSLGSHFVQIFSLAKTGPMLMLSVVFIYTGIELTFWSGLYGTTIANTLKFTTPSKELLALNTIFIGLGEILGGGLFGIFGSKFNRAGRNPIILLASVVHLSAFFLIFMNIPSEATLGHTKMTSYIEPNEYLALFCSVLIGFGDACWNTQIYALIGSIYTKNSASAFGLFKFYQSASACGAFFYSGHLLLQWQLLILALLTAVAAVSFFTVELKAQQIALDQHEKHP